MKIAINSNNLLKNLGAVFTDRTKVITELAQNARRAGATEVRIDVDAARDILSVADDGIGITDMQALLTLAESGWDQKTVEQEGPYGMGFFATFFVAKRVLIESGDLSLDIPDTAALIRGEQVEPVRVAQSVGGTRVTLFGLSMLKSYNSDTGQSFLNDAVAQLFRGFPIPVRLNGGLVERPDAIDVFKSEISCDVPNIGRIQVQLDEALLRGSVHPRLYLQGFNVSHDNYHRLTNAVVHLDPVHFKGRMPDRDVLLNAQEATEAVSKALTKVISEEASQRIRTQQLEFDINAWYPLLRSMGATAVLNECPLLPTGMFYRYAYKPMVASVDTVQMDHLPQMTKATVAQLLEKSGQIYTDAPDEGDLSDADDTGAKALAAYLLGTMFLSSNSLHEGHWLFELLPEELPSLTYSKMKVRVSAKGNPYKADMQGSLVAVPVTVADQVTLSVDGLGTVQLTDTPVYVEAIGVVIPRKGFDANVLHHITQYENEGEYLDSDFEDDSQLLESIYKLANGTEPEEVLQQYLPFLPENIRKCVASRTFTLKADQEGRLTVVEVKSPT